MSSEPKTAEELKTSLFTLANRMNMLAHVLQDWQEGMPVRLILKQETPFNQEVSLVAKSDDDDSFLISTPLNMLLEETQKQLDQQTKQLAAL